MYVYIYIYIYIYIFAGRMLSSACTSCPRLMVTAMIMTMTCNEYYNGML